MGMHMQFIIKEGLFVSAQDTRKKQVDLINAKSNFTKFYKEAYFHKLLGNLPDKISIYFLNDMKKQFDIYFIYLYPNIKEADEKQLSKDLGIFSTDDVKKIKPDFTNPNKLIKIFKNPVSQLYFFTVFGKYKIIKKLIENGADVNYKRFNDDGTVLIASLENEITPDHILIAKYLIPKMSKDILDAQLLKKKETALSYAINRGLVDVVELLTKYSVDLEQRVSLDEQTALYYSIDLIGKIKNGLKSTMDCSDNSKFQKVNPLEDEVELKKILDANNYPNKIFDEEKKEYLNKLQNDPLRKTIKKLIMEDENSIEIWYHSNLDNAYKIFNLILEHTKKIDASHKNEFTALIFATELNDELLVKKLLDKGANPDYYTVQNFRAYDYAMRNENTKLMELLE
jgi:ankyrin repeat protein